jgi:hypothetical protein
MRLSSARRFCDVGNALLRLSKIEGVKTVAIYPAQQPAGVQFAGNGTTTTARQLIDKLSHDGIEATAF